MVTPRCTSSIGFGMSRLCQSLQFQPPDEIATGIATSEQAPEFAIFVEFDLPEYSTKPLLTALKPQTASRLSLRGQLMVASSGKYIVLKKKLNILELEYSCEVAC